MTSNLDSPSASTQRLRPVYRDPALSRTDTSPADIHSSVSPPTRASPPTDASRGERDQYTSNHPDIHPSPTTLGRERSSPSSGPSHYIAAQPTRFLSDNLTPAERSAQELRQALTAPPPDSINQLAA